MKIAVIAGTGEATELIDIISQRHEVTAFTATSYGTEILRNSDCRVNEGRLDEEGFTAALSGFDAVADMSHPFAEIVSVTVKKVCLKLDIPYVRGGREKLNYDYEKIISVSSKEEAAEILKNKTGNIFLTTGVNTLKFYEAELSDRKHQIFARILDSPESRKISENSQVSIIYAVPPFSEEDTCRVISEKNINVIVSKDSGRRGGLIEKISAAKKYGTEVILIKSPEDCTVHTPQETADILESREFYER